MNRRMKSLAGLIWRNGLLLALLCTIGISAYAQLPGQVQPDLAGIDGMELKPEHILNYRIRSGLSNTVNAVVKGRLVYRALGLSFSYSFPYTVRPGLNMIDGTGVHPQWTFSTPALKELFMDYGKLPAGTYEYCVEVLVAGPGGEQVAGGNGRECIYQQVNDVFLINLVDPENNAKLYERYPLLSWMVNYPFATALTYKVRVAAVKEGQNNTTAVNRNNPVYEEKNIAGTSVAYPVYARPLELNQPYAWTVDAYYKGLLLGGAEPWRFTIIEDSVMMGLPHTSYFVDIRKEQNNTAYYAVGIIKLKYVVEDWKKELLTLTLTDAKGKVINLKQKELKAVLGDNRFEIDLQEQAGVKHLGIYRLEVRTDRGATYLLPVRYINPDFLK